MTLDERRERDRFTVMKILKADGLRFYEMVPKLRAMGLLGCQKCDDPENQRRTREGVVCVTCENVVNQEWHRNLTRLSEDDAAMLEVKWEWLEAHRHMARLCRKHAVRKEKIGDTVVSFMDNKAARLYLAIMDKLAKFHGINVAVPLKPPIDRRKANVYRHASAGGGGSDSDIAN